MQYLKYFENYDKEGLVRKFYENALHHDDPNALENINQKYNTNPLDFITDKEIIDYNAGNIFDYLLKNGLEIDFDNEDSELVYMTNNGKFKIVKALYNNNYFVDFIENKKTIKMPSRKVKTLEGIEIFKNLERLSCIGNKIQSLEPVRYLTELRILACSFNKIQSLEPLRNLTKLTKLYCDNNQIHSLEPIKHLSSQLELEISNFAGNPLNQESQELLRNTI